MRSYDNYDLMSYDLGSLNWTAANTTAIPVPADASGARILGYAIHDVTVAFTADTTPGYLDFGTAGDADKFGHLAADVIAAGDGLHVLGNDDLGAGIDLARAGDAGVALTQIEVATVAMTGGTPGGTGRTTVFIGWY